MLLQMSIFHSFYGATSFYAFLANGTATARMPWLPGSVSISARTQKNTKSSSSSPMGSVSLKLSLEPVLSPPTFWQTGPSGPISNPTGPISLPLHTFIPALPSLPPLSENSETNIISHQVDFIFILNVWSWYNSHVCTVGQYSAARPPKNSEVSSHAFKSLAAHRSRWNDRDLHTLWDLLWSVLIQLFIHLATLATEL